MILDQLSQADQYAALHPLFAPAFAFLRRPDLAELAPGRHEIDGEQLYAIISRGPGRHREGTKMESHRAYIDIQYVGAGIDEMGWKSVDLCAQPEGEFNVTKDYLLFTDEPDAYVATGPGAFAIFFPGDAHTPLLSPGELHKVVVKVAVNP